MDRIFIRQLEKWHRAGLHHLIIERLEGREDLLDYHCVCCLARAYNNRGLAGDYEKAVRLLDNVADFGAEDFFWHYRKGFALFGLGQYGEAEAAFGRAMELNPEREDVATFLQRCRSRLAEGKRRLSKEERAELGAFIRTHYGHFDQVLQENDGSPEICVIPPQEGQNFYTLVTLGMSAEPMSVPEALKGEQLERAELLICLPPDWNICSSEERWYWPIRLLRKIAAIPVQEGSWIGWGHTISQAHGFDATTDQCGAVLIAPESFGRCQQVCNMDDGRRVNFYQVISLYDEELQLKHRCGTMALLDKINKNCVIVNPMRKNFCADPDHRLQHADGKPRIC